MAQKDSFSTVIVSQMAANLLPIDWALKTATLDDVGWTTLATHANAGLGHRGVARGGSITE